MKKPPNKSKRGAPRKTPQQAGHDIRIRIRGSILETLGCDLNAGTLDPAKKIAIEAILKAAAKTLKKNGQSN